MPISTHTAPMIRLANALKTWGTPDFKATLAWELQQLGAGALPLQQGLAHSSHALEDDFSPVLIAAEEDGKRILAKLGIFYYGLVAGCSCADDPTPVEAQNEYCEVLLAIDKDTAEATVTLLRE